jgi:hypothetical protein
MKYVDADWNILETTIIGGGLVHIVIATIEITWFLSMAKDT